MPTPISQFNSAALLLNTDIVAGLRTQNDYTFPIIGIGDSLGSPIISWSQGAGSLTVPNINSINFQNNTAGNAPIISVNSSGAIPDTQANLTIEALGIGYVDFTGTGMIKIPVGTTGQRPTNVAGGLRLNSTDGLLEFDNGSVWIPIPITSVTSVTGTANEITASPTTGDVVLSIPTTFVAPGSITATTTISGTTFNSSTLTASELVLTDGSKNLVSAAHLNVPLGGTGNTTFTAYSVICAGTTATGTFQDVSGVGTSGQVLTSNGPAALPTWQTDSSGGGLFVDQTTSTRTLAPFTTYLTDNGASLVTYTLPASPTIGDWYEIIGYSSGGWQVAQNASNQIIWGYIATTVGTSGALIYGFHTDKITLRYCGSNTWVCYATQGLPQVV